MCDTLTVTFSNMATNDQAIVNPPASFKVGAHEGTGRRDLLQGLVACRVYTVDPSCGDMSLEVFTGGDLLRSET